MKFVYYIFWVCICSLGYPACKAHKPYYFFTCVLLGSTKSFLVVTQTLRFWKKKMLLGTKYVFWYSLQLCVKHFILKRMNLYWNTSIHRSSLESTCYSCQVLMKLEFSRRCFDKSSNVKFHENPSSGRRVVLCGRTDGCHEASSRFSQFCEKHLKISPNK